jgi:hypothetical protein
LDEYKKKTDREMEAVIAKLDDQISNWCREIFKYNTVIS